MRRSIEKKSTMTRSSRLLGAIGLFVFIGAFFVMPLYAALSLCTMPCCHHGSSGLAPVVSADMPVCQTHCSIAAADVSTAATRTVLPDNGSQRGVPVVTAGEIVADARLASAAVSPAASPGRGGTAPLHILNSTLRI